MLTGADQSTGLLEEAGQKWKRKTLPRRKDVKLGDNHSQPLYLPPDPPQIHQAFPRGQFPPAPGPLHMPITLLEVSSQPFLTTPLFKANSH